MSNRADSTLTAVEVLALAALSDRPRYGYELVERIEQLSRGELRVRPGNLYRVLHRLEGRGLAREMDGSAVEGPAAEGAAARRQYFEVTSEGRTVAARQLHMYAQILESAPELRAALGDV